MSIKLHTPCDDGVCPYDAQYNHNCEWWCGAEEPEDLPKDDDFEESDFDLEMGFDPYMGCYSDDC